MPHKGMIQYYCVITYHRALCVVIAALSCANRVGRFFLFIYHIANVRKMVLHCPDYGTMLFYLAELASNSL